MSIDRPETPFDGASHKYRVPGWEDSTLGVSTVAKIGEAVDVFGIAAAWGFRVGYEGAHDVLIQCAHDYPYFDKDQLREELKQRGLTPWSRRDQAAERGNWVHDLLERLGQEGQVGGVLESVPPEWRGHATGVLTWYLEYRPSFVALEVQVASRTYGFAGRYDVRCAIPGDKLGNPFHGDRVLCLVDLKTSKRIQPLSHYPQLAGYELASVEMGFPATDAQFVLNTHPDGTYDFKQSYATGEDFVAYLGAMRAIRRLQAEDPEEKLRRAREEQLLANLPGLSRDLKTDTGPLAGCDGKAIGILCSGLRKRGLVQQDERKVWSVVAPAELLDAGSEGA